MEIVIFKTLMHSIWQGLILALSVSAVLLLTRNASAALRYKMLIGCLFLFTLGSTGTFIYHLNNAADPILQVAGTDEATTQTKQITSELSDNGENLKTYFIATLNYLNRHSLIIVWCWIGMIILKSLKMAYDLRQWKQLRTEKLFHPGEFWEKRLEILADKLNVKRKITLFQSGLAKVPMVAGHFKPVILLPLGLINNLSMAEVDAILCHELAHIRRRDFLVNLLQHFVEIIFFFNPAVLWLNRLIRKERENCCDDISLMANNSVRDYVNALVSCAEYATKNNKFALAFSGRKGELLGRVHRMINKKPIPAGYFQKFSIVAALILVQLLTAAISIPVAINQRNGKKEKAVNDKNKLPEIVNPMPTAQSVLQSDAFGRTAVTTTTTRTTKTSSLAIDCDPLPVPEIKEPDQLPPVPEPIHDDDIFTEHQRATDKLAADNEELKKRIADIDKAKLKEIRTGVEQQVSNQMVDGRKFNEEHGRQLHEELFAEGLIKNKNKTSYMLSQREFIIDGVKQTEGITAKYANKYLLRPGMRVLFNYSVDRSVITISD